MTLTIGIDFEHICNTPAYRDLSKPSSVSIDLPLLTKRLLALLDEAQQKATFFVVGETAKKYPELIREIASQGHEIASHTYTHPSLPELTPEQIHQELTKSKDVLESITGKNVSGFRAPTFQIDDRVYRLLIESGYKYSSSVLPTVPIPGFYSNRYNFTEPISIETPKGALTEYPVPTSPFLPFPISGAWTRLLGRKYTLVSLQRRLQDEAITPTYIHPWEFAALGDTPLPFHTRFRTGEWTKETFRRILSLTCTSWTLDCLHNQQEFTVDRQYILSK